MVKEVKGWAPSWFVAKETWSGGCQSLVAIFRAKGRERRWLTGGIMERPPGTAREPCYRAMISWVNTACQVEITGGQKSSCTSTTIRAGLNICVAIVALLVGTMCVTNGQRPFGPGLIKITASNPDITCWTSDFTMNPVLQLITIAAIFEEDGNRIMI